MSIDKMKRVMLRIRADHPGSKCPKIYRKELEKAIMIEVGTSLVTYHRTVQVLIRLGWIHRSKWRFQLTGRDLTEDFI